MRKLGLKYITNILAFSLACTSLLVLGSCSVYWTEEPVLVKEETEKVPSSTQALTEQQNIYDTLGLDQVEYEDPNSGTAQSSSSNDQFNLVTNSTDVDDSESDNGENSQNEENVAETDTDTIASYLDSFGTDTTVSETETGVDVDSELENGTALESSLGTDNEGDSTIDLGSRIGLNSDVNPVIIDTESGNHATATEQLANDSEPASDPDIDINANIDDSVICKSLDHMLDDYGFLPSYEESFKPHFRAARNILCNNKHQLMEQLTSKIYKGTGKVSDVPIARPINNKTDKISSVAFATALVEPHTSLDAHVALARSYCVGLDEYKKVYGIKATSNIKSLQIVKGTSSASTDQSDVSMCTYDLKTTSLAKYKLDHKGIALWASFLGGRLLIDVNYSITSAWLVGLMSFNITFKNEGEDLKSYGYKYLSVQKTSLQDILVPLFSKEYQSLAVTRLSALQAITLRLKQRDVIK